MAYVTPFFRYEPAGELVHLVNEITGAGATVPAAHLDLLAEAHRDEAFVLPTEVAGQFAELGIVFDGQAEAGQWLRTASGSGATAFPHVDQIELTNRCPYTCQMCPRTTSMQRSLGNMPMDLFERVVSQLAGRQDYTALHHFGESLLHPHIDEAVRIALRHGVRTGLSCNPPTLTPALSRRLLDAGIANLLLSLDSLDAATYRSSRGTAARLDKADQHVRELIRLRDGMGSGTWVTLQMIAMRVNQDEIDRFLKYCADVGVDRGVVVRLGRWDFDDDTVAELGEHDSPGYTAPCRLPETSVAVLWDGRVVPCCHDYDGQVVLGDLTTSTLAEVWSGPAATRFRARNESYALCQNCAFSLWFKQRQRDERGFLSFHRAMATGGSTRYEWTNPVSLGRRDGGELFDRFDVYTTNP